MDGATAQPAGDPVAVHSDGSPGTPPVGLTVALLEPNTPSAPAWGVALTLKIALPPAAMPVAVVMVHTKSRPADCVPDDAQPAVKAPAPGAALLNAKLGGSLSFTTIVAAEVPAPAALLMVNT